MIALIPPSIRRRGLRDPGVYASFSGAPGRAAQLWAAVLAAGPRAMLSHQTAAELDCLADAPSSLIHLTVPGDRRIRLRDAVAARSRVPRRRTLTELLSPDLAGVHSVVEYRCVRDVERPHGFPPARLQAAVRRAGHNEYLDLLYEEQATVVELDGRVAHPGDIRRDNATTTSGRATLRYGWPARSATC